MFYKITILQIRIKVIHTVSDLSLKIKYRRIEGEKEIQTQKTGDRAGYHCSSNHCAGWRSQTKVNSVAEATKIVQLEKVDKRDLSDFISLTGTVSGETKINYSSTAATEIKTVNVQVGDVVKEGDVIATLDKDSIQKQINVLEKSLSNAAALKQNETNQNQRTLERAKEDQKNQLAQANDSINSAEAAYTAAQNTINSLNNQIKSVSDQVNAASDEDIKAALQEKLSDLQDQLSSAKSDLTSADSARKEAKNNYTSVKSSTDDAIYSAQNSIESAKYKPDG